MGIIIINVSLSTLSVGGLVLWWVMESLRRQVWIDVASASETPKRTVFRALLPFVWVGCLSVVVNSVWRVATDIVLENDGIGTPETVSIGFSMLTMGIFGREAWRWYRLWKESDDDFWKKKRKKASDKVKEIAGKLVVVPEPSLAPVRV